MWFKKEKVYVGEYVRGYYRHECNNIKNWDFEICKFTEDDIKDIHLGQYKIHEEWIDPRIIILYEDYDPIVKARELKRLNYFNAYLKRKIG